MDWQRRRGSAIRWRALHADSAAGAGCDCPLPIGGFCGPIVARHGKRVGLLGRQRVLGTDSGLGRLDDSGWHPEREFVGRKIDVLAEAAANRV
jgi:hypothetical protein